MKLPEHLRLRAFTLIAGVICGMALCSCSENDGEGNEYANWKPRNESYFSKIMQTTGDSIAYAKRVYGEKWEEFSNRRQFLCFSRQFDAAHKQTDSIAVEILKRGADNGVLPYSNDSVRVAYRTLLIPTDQHPTGLVVDHSGFSSEYNKVFDRTTMAPSTFCVSALVHGVSTALLYMHRGDRWRITMPSDLAYGARASGTIPKYSTVVFEMELVEIYRKGTSPGVWQ